MSENEDFIKVVFARRHDPSPPLVDAVSEAMFNRARNLVIRACVKHGTVGPSGEHPSGKSRSAVLNDPEFYIVDDWYGDDMRILIEPKPNVISPRWLRDLARTLHFLPNWDVLISPGEGVSLLLRPGRLEITGWRSDAPGLPGITRELRRYVNARVHDRHQSVRKREIQVKRLLPGAWRMSEGEPLALVAFFQTRSDGTVGDSAWILHFEDKSEFDLDDYCFEPDALRPSLYVAKRSGEITPDTGSNPTGPDTALLAEWILVAEGKPVIGARKLLITKGDQTWRFDLMSLRQVRTRR